MTVINSLTELAQAIDAGEIIQSRSRSAPAIYGEWTDLVESAVTLTGLINLVNIGSTLRIKPNPALKPVDILTEVNFKSREADAIIQAVKLIIEEQLNDLPME